MLGLKYFVLKPRAKTPDDAYAIASCRALFVYADMIEDVDPELASSIKEWATEEEMNRIADGAL